MTASLKITGPEERDLFRFRSPSNSALSLLGLSAVESVDLAGFIPEGPASGIALFSVAGIAFVRGCVYRP
ncbi:hypothetical protein ACFYPC_33885 [Streptomyces sp. NPDC005808]|uniref:hypothetical protein n=1 Tax=Streptomyces sp. NPDC005808 TaxID=3364734 RepID=UPI0036BEC5E1